MNIFKTITLILTLCFFAEFEAFASRNLDRNFVDEYIEYHTLPIEKDIDHDQMLIQEHRIEEKISKLKADKKIIIPEELKFKGQRRSLTPWGKINLDEFLSWNQWKRDQIEKDNSPEWESAARERSKHEMVGRIYQCAGKCRVDRGEGFFHGDHRTNLYEGDDIETDDNSYLWIFLFDGTMLRLSPKSSVSIHEFNIGVESNFINARINYGNVLWLSRSENLLKESNQRETDVIFYPFAQYETIPVQDVKKYDENNLFELLGEPNTNLNYLKKLNSYIEKNNQMTKSKKTYAFIITPNVTVFGFSPSAEFIHLLGGETHVKQRDGSQLEHVEKSEMALSEIQFQLRGLENKENHGLPEGQWITVNAFGTSFAPAENEGRFSPGEFLTKRPTRILLGRELFLQNYSSFVFEKDMKPMRLASEFGYRLWGKIDDKGVESTEDLTLRIEYLKEYARRMETTNLKSKLVYHERLKMRGLAIDNIEYGDYFYSRAMDAYYINGEVSSDIITEDSLKEPLNSTKKELWKKMHGIR